MHDMWQAGACVREHNLTEEDYAAGRCLTCKRRSNARRYHDTKPGVQWQFRMPAVVDERWQEKAICFGVEDPDSIFFPNRGQKAGKARSICQHCPLAVRRDCLADSLQRDEDRDHGIRAGLTPDQRQEVFQGKRSFEDALGILDEPTVSIPHGYEIAKAIRELADLARMVV